MRFRDSVESTGFCGLIWFCVDLHETGTYLRYLVSLYFLISGALRLFLQGHIAEQTGREQYETDHLRLAQRAYHQRIGAKSFYKEAFERIER